MDNLNNAGSIAGIISLIGGISYAVVRIISHSHCKSMCCGQQTSLDVDIGTPTLKPLNEPLTRQSQLKSTTNDP